MSRDSISQQLDNIIAACRRLQVLAEDPTCLLPKLAVAQAGAAILQAAQTLEQRASALEQYAKSKQRPREKEE